MRISYNSYFYNEDYGYKINCFPSVKDVESAFYFSSFGRMYKENLIDFPAFDKCLLIYSEKGCGKALIDGVWQEIPAGSAIYYPYNVPIRYEPIDSAPWQVAFITFAGKKVESTIGSAKISVLHNDGLSFISRLVDQLTEMHNSPEWFEFSGGALYYLLLKLHRLVNNITTDNVNDIAINRIMDSVKYVTMHFTEELFVSELAKDCFVGESYYCKLFKRLTGASPVDYITSLRISKACDLLIEYPNKKISAVALECGFNNSTYFNKIFKERVGLSPSEFRTNKD